MGEGTLGGHLPLQYSVQLRQLYLSFQACKESSEKVKTGQEKQQSRSKQRVSLRDILKDCQRELFLSGFCWKQRELQGEEADFQLLNLCKTPACGKDGHPEF